MIPQNKINVLGELANKTDNPQQPHISTVQGGF